MALPPAVLEESPEAASHLVRCPGVRLFVDGYNVTFTSWSGADPTGRDLPWLRHRLVSALSELALRLKLPVSVVFDGRETGGRGLAPPVSSPWLRIVFSASGVEADDVIVELLEEIPADVPVVVATDDRELQRRAGAVGANVINVGQLLGVIGRQADLPGGDS